MISNKVESIFLSCHLGARKNINFLFHLKLISFIHIPIVYKKNSQSIWGWTYQSGVSVQFKSGTPNKLWSKFFQVFLYFFFFGKRNLWKKKIFSCLFFFVAALAAITTNWLCRLTLTQTQLDMSHHALHPPPSNTPTPRPKGKKKVRQDKALPNTPLRSLQS